MRDMETDVIYNEDCIEGMKRIPDGSVDCIICDLPYGTTACPWDSVIPFGELWGQYKRIIKPAGAIALFCSQPFTSALVMSNIEWFKYCWIWVKNRSTGHVHAKNKPLKKHEEIAVFSPGTTVHASQSSKRMTYNPQGLVRTPEGTVRRRNDKGDDAVMSYRASYHDTPYDWENYPESLLYADMVRGEERMHPTQKPVDLVQYLVRTYSNPGDIVLDNCMGSGTTAVACIREGRHYIGFETDPDYFRKACERIERERGEFAERAREELEAKRNALF